LACGGPCHYLEIRTLGIFACLHEIMQAGLHACIKSIRPRLPGVAA
jgi:hypothetical protein